MHVTPLCVVFFALASGCFSLILAETCSNLTTRCQTLQEEFREAGWAFYAEQWNITDEEANRTAPAAGEFCRVSHEAGECLKALNERCPEHELPRDYSGWFMAAWYTFHAKLCFTPFGPRRYMPALRACYDTNEDIPDRPSPPFKSPLSLQSHSASSAQRNACRTLMQFMAHVNGTAHTAVMRQCGDEGRRILMESWEYLYLDNCNSINEVSVV
ncbi:uncharacterized protein LOC129588780 [Paramacrobiotus metropolitanus]|uniref:uncharacterized protein LOC129588780 n=1 Tax=Paramacrobiotus metropolitanus TaxID=2943436 RepID=UPI002445906D|nr:uncharacterized protein LOC129588780 [Paramacrobiotus metropolitanus]